MKNEIAIKYGNIASADIYKNIESALDEYEKSLEPKCIPDLFHPGSYVKEEMKAHGWDLGKLCLKMTTPLSDVQAILNEDFTIGTHEAGALARAFDTSADMWLNLQATHNAGIAIEKMKAAEELRKEVIRAGLHVTPSEWDNIRKIALARKFTKGADNG